MDLTSVLLKAVAARPHVLLTVMPAASAVRLAAERELRRCGLPLASTPAAADILLVAGHPDPALRAAIERLARDMPAPRAVAFAGSPDRIAPALASARARLGEAAAQRTAAGAAGGGADRAGRPARGAKRDGHGGHSGRHGHESGDAESGQGHAVEHGPGDGGARTGRGSHGRPGDHGNHGSGHTETQLPGTLPMAQPGEDRDGLTLDRLHLPLGPLLSDWPAGLTIRTTVQGDVIQQADVDTSSWDRAVAGTNVWTEPWELAAAGQQVTTGAAARRRAAAHLDSLGRLLAVADWPAAATAARRLRDDLLDGTASAAVRPRAERLARRVGRSRTLYWLTRGIGGLSAADATAAGLSGPAVRADGDVPARYRTWLSGVLDDLDRLDDPAPLDPDADEGPRGRVDSSRPPSAILLELLPGLLEGAELAAARLIVASLDPDPDELAARQGEAAGG